MRLLLPSLLLVLATGCVRQSTYDALKGECDADRARLDLALSEEQAKAEQLRREVEALELRIQALTDEKANLLKDQSQLEGSLAELQEALAELEKRKRAADARVAEFKSLLGRFQALVDAGRLRVKIVDGRMVVELATDVLFDSGKADLSDEGKEAITEVTGLLVGIPDRRFQVEGHTDNVPIKTARFPSNWELASARAITVIKTMIEAGMPTTRVSAASFGEFKPAETNETDEGRARNRRIEIVVVPDLSTLPGFEELQKIGAPTN
ncbi:MAG: OmpA family protein [Myxococcales bacterium]|nr:OmpA family protein [Myxococcales bacterium]